ncbi:protein of unknown function (DUF4123) [Shewanella psychrophila]|uniref:DUF4123 domain-containing protein n=1 Tax=Shewanella psychrophila TaxID=225848 RepID=A0A1S6HU18_9GAMM|nr:DUF4123 domain-containing protein [Shewanella psychrophila]AQS38984.1 protein of unknown function (DUF4123) [Shewanella psychrophila]
MNRFSSTSQLPSLEENSMPRWLVLDGALLPELEKQLVLLAHQHSVAVEYRALLLGTRWENVADVGPYLVGYFPALETWVQSQSLAAYRYGVVFASDADFSVLEAHWKVLIACEHSGLEGALSRLYDPVIMQHLLSSTDDIKLSAWLGPMQTLWLPEPIQQHYWQISQIQFNQTEQTQTQQIVEKPLDNAVFTDNEWLGLSQASLYYSARRLMPHLQLFFPAKRLATEADTHQFIVERLNELHTLGSVDEQLATYYLNVFCRLGNVLDSNTRYPEVRTCLLDHTQPLSGRLRQANFMSISFVLNPRSPVKVLS